MKTLTASSILLLASSAFAADAPTLTGRWSVHTSVSGNEIDQECKFVQEDSKLTGSWKSTDKEVQITGGLDGKKVTWKYDSQYNGTALTATYTATIDDPKKISGTVDVQPYGVTGEFSAV